MYDWVNGRPALLMRLHDLELWPGTTAPGADLRLDPQRFATLASFEGASVLAVHADALTTVVPLELGGLLLVSATYCDDDGSVADHLDLVPVAGWEPMAEPFVAFGDDYALFDGAQRGSDLVDPRQEQTIVAESGGVVPVNLPPGRYDVELLGPWRPDDRTELYLTRLVRQPTR